jgi:hypothetical protein
MKPIILVIVSGAMLVLAMHQDTKSENAETSRSSNKHTQHVKVQEKKLDTEALTHNVSMWLDRLQ